MAEEKITIENLQMQMLVAAILASGTMVANPGEPNTAYDRYAGVLKIIRQKGLNPP